MAAKRHCSVFKPSLLHIYNLQIVTMSACLIYFFFTLALHPKHGSFLIFAL